jgi:hypothetical protein
MLEVMGTESVSLTPLQRQGVGRLNGRYAALSS